MCHQVDPPGMPGGFSDSPFEVVLCLLEFPFFHGHEPLDTDTTATLEGEDWLMHHGYTQAEGVANLDQVPETGCLVTIGYPKFKGGLGGYARYVAICPADWRYGISVGEVPEAPLPRSDKALRWDTEQGVRLRK